MTFGKRILILVPHPDDEVVACSASIGHAQAQGAAIFALYLTHGCIARQTLWPWQRAWYHRRVQRRLDEAGQAADFLNIAPLHRSPGHPLRPARQLWRELDAVYDEIKTAIAAHAIDQLWLPAYEGGNPDHDGLNAIGQLFKADIGVLEFAEYNFHQGRAQAQTFPYPNGSETVVALSDDERKRKRAALAVYASEQVNLNYIGTQRECYRPLADYDYNRPPHPGTLWYARFQWVPFRHPRIDFSKPAEISAAIGAFLSAKQQGFKDQP